MNQTPASAQDPFVCRLVNRVSIIALKLGPVEVRSWISRIFSAEIPENTMGSDQLEGSKIDNRTSSRDVGIF